MNIMVRLLAVLGGLVAVLVIAVLALLLFAPGIHTSSIEMAMNVITGRGGDSSTDELLQRLRAAPGYRVSIFARELPHPRMLARDSEGRLLVSNPRSGEVILLEDRDGDGAADRRDVLLSGLRRPHGIALHGSALLVAESHQLIRVDYDVADGSVGGDLRVLTGGFTDDGNHWSKSIAVNAAGELFVAMGSTCNVCLEADPRRATILRFDPDGGNGRIYASGLRNSVGLAFAPWDGSLYATDNGRDLLGDDFPPCELNRIVDGGFYGWPYLNGNNLPDPDFGDQGKSLQQNALAPVFAFPAHNAPLGIHFDPGDGERRALVALHGSWNRSEPDGYRVLRLSWTADDRIESEDFLWGFEQQGNIVGRPVDITDDGRGGFFISDDYARVIYRVSASAKYSSPGAGSTTPSTGSVELDPVLAAAGAELYASMPCGACHDADAPTPVALTDLAGRYSVSSLSEYFLTPTPPMPLYDLTDLQRRQLAHFLLDERAAQD